MSVSIAVSLPRDSGRAEETNETVVKRLPRDPDIVIYGFVEDENKGGV